MTAVTPNDPLWVAARTLLAAQAKEFFSRWKKMASNFGVEEIHDLRVASRRVREALALFTPCFPRDEFSTMAKQVKKLTRLLGELRNTDEALLFFSALSAEEIGEHAGAVGTLTAGLQEEREKTRKKVKAKLKLLHPGPLRATFRRARNHPRLFGQEPAPFLTIREFAAGGIEAREKPVRELIPQARQEGDHDAQHRLRIAVKHLRYRLEILEPLFISGFPELRQGLKGYQDLLGKMHDLDVFAEMVRQRQVEEQARQRLLAVLAKRRGRLYGNLLDLLEANPLEKFGEKARHSL